MIHIYKRGSEGDVANVILCDGLELMFAYFVYYMAPALVVYCTVMVLWSSSVVSLLYEAVV